MRLLAISPALLAALLLVSCGKDEAPASPKVPRGKPVVYTTFHPTTYFAKRLAAGDADVVLPLPEGEDPVFWEPDADTIRAYQQADLVVVNGAEMEKWVLHATLVPSRVVETARPFRAEWLTFRKAVEHSHGPSGLHSHQGIDGHTWLDPVFAKAQAREIAQALERLLPDKAVPLRERLAALDADLDDLHSRFQNATQGGGEVALFTAHPAYEYLAKRYGLQVVDFAFDPDEAPSPAALAEVAERLTTLPARLLLWESAPTAANAEAFRKLGLESVVVSPVENPSPAELAAGDDYLTVMRRNAATLADAITRSRGR